MTYPLLLGSNLVHVLSILSQNLSYNALSAKFRAFTTNLDRIQIPKNIQEALEIPKLKEAVMEEIRALEKKWDLGRDDFSKREEISGL